MSGPIINAIFYNFAIGVAAVGLNFVLFELFYFRLKNKKAPYLEWIFGIYLGGLMYGCFHFSRSIADNYRLVSLDTRTLLLWAWIIPWGVSVIYYVQKAQKRKRDEEEGNNN